MKILHCFATVLRLIGSILTTDWVYFDVQVASLYFNQRAMKQVRFLSENDEICIQNDEFCIKNDGFCI